MRIKLPGSLKTKVILLIILVLFSIGIFIKEGVDNKNANSTNINVEDKFIKSK